MKNFFSLLLILLPLFCMAQVDPVPEEYLDEYNEIWQEYGAYDQGSYGVRLHPLDHLFIAPTQLSVANNGNWAVDFLNIDGYTPYIRQNAKASVVFIIMDTAGELDHQDLSKYELKKYSKSFTGEPKADGHGHGHHCAGDIGGDESKYRLGPASVLFQIGKAKFIMLKGLTNQGSGSTQQLFDGMKYAAGIAPELQRKGYKVIFSGSFGGRGTNSTLDRGVKLMEDAGILPIFAAGNNNSDLSTPANGDSAHGVGAQNTNGSKASFSNYGSKLYSSAPGVRILSTMPGGGYAEMSGTSMACPIFAACAGIVWSLNPGLSNRQVSHYTRFYILRVGGKKWSQQFGWGSPIYNDLWIKDAPTAGIPDRSNGNPNTVNPPYGGGEPEKEICNDGKDNDNDGLIDCEDPDCPPCQTDEICGDGKDNDGDGLIDCDDLDCQPCQVKDSKRYIRTVTTKVPMRWRPNIRTAPLRTTYVEWEVRFLTDKAAQQASDYINNILTDYSSRSFMVLFNDSDDMDAGKYGEVFFQYYLNRNFKELKADVVLNYAVSTEGAKFFVPDTKTKGLLRKSPDVQSYVGFDAYEYKGAHVTVKQNFNGLE